MGWFNHQLENWRKIRLRISFRADVNMRAEPKGPMFWECFRARVHRTQKKTNGVDGKTGGRQLKVLRKTPTKVKFRYLNTSIYIWFIDCILYICQNAFTKAGRQPCICSSICTQKWYIQMPEALSPSLICLEKTCRVHTRNEGLWEVLGRWVWTAKASKAHAKTRFMRRS